MYLSPFVVTHLQYVTYRAVSVWTTKNFLSSFHGSLTLWCYFWPWTIWLEIWIGWENFFSDSQLWWHATQICQMQKARNWFLGVKGNNIYDETYHTFIHEHFCKCCFFFYRNARCICIFYPLRPEIILQICVIVYTVYTVKHL